MSEDRRRILDMLAAGKITAAEAERLLDAVSRRGDEPVAGAKPKPKYLLVHVDSFEDGRPAKVNVRVPLQILRAGVKLASVMPAFAKNKVNDALREQGIQFDLDNLRPEDMEDLIEALGDMTVDVDDQNAKVHIHCE